VKDLKKGGGKTISHIWREEVFGKGDVAFRMGTGKARKGRGGGEDREGQLILEVRRFSLVEKKKTLLGKALPPKGTKGGYWGKGESGAHKGKKPQPK